MKVSNVKSKLSVSKSVVSKFNNDSACTSTVIMTMNNNIGTVIMTMNNNIGTVIMTM